MSDEPIYCPAQTFVGNRIEPPEFCDNEVDDHGDLCQIHEEADRADEEYEQYLEDRAERLADPENYCRDFGD